MLRTIRTSVFFLVVWLFATSARSQTPNCTPVAGTTETNCVGHVSATGYFLSTGASSGLVLQDRDNSANQFVFYSHAGRARLWRNGPGDLFFFTPTGRMGIGLGVSDPNAPLGFAPAEGPKVDLYTLDAATGSRYGLGLFSVQTGGTPIAVSALYANAAYGSAGSSLGTFDGSTYVPVLTARVNGRVGIGDIEPAAPLHVATPGTGTTIGSNVVATLRSGGTGLDTSLQFSDGTNQAYVDMIAGDLVFATGGSTERMRLTRIGNLSVPSAISTSGASGAYFFHERTSIANPAGWAWYAQGNYARLYRSNSSGETDVMLIDTAGNVTISGNINAKYQDIAEWVPVKESLAPGTVVVLDKTSANTVTASIKPYDTTVAGVISPKPGVILGEAGDDKAMVATTGRVKVRVRATRPIEIGDLLVTSEVAGVAMPSEPIDVAGVAIHRPGTVIGKALEKLESGEGEILVLLSLQ
jgi:hypothetical protein